MASARSLFAWEAFEGAALASGAGRWGVVSPMFCAVAGRRSFSGGKEMQIIIKGISEIKPYENNQRNNDSAVAV